MASNLGDKFSPLHEIVRAARNNLAPGPWDYLIGGAETETTVRRNRLALDSIAFRPRVLRDVSKIDTTSTFFGRPVRIPVMLAPIGSIETFAEGGGATAAKASEEFGVPQMLSSVCNPGLEAVAAAANNFRVFQLYVRGDDAWVDDWVRRAVDHGYAAFCLTVDTACYSRRERDLARRFVKPWRTRAGGFEFQAGLSWDHVKRFKDTHSIPLVLKGIATAEDATLATDHGVEGVYVSNHGGRQLDHGRGAIEALPEVVRAVGGRRAPRRRPRTYEGGGDRDRREPPGDGPQALDGRARADPRPRFARGADARARRHVRRDPERRAPAGRR